MPEILTIGEPLVLFASQDSNTNLAESRHFYKFIAGAELNFAIGASRLGHHVEYVSQIGKDPLGTFILSELQKNNVNTSYISIDSSHPTGIEFKSKTDQGDPDTFYIRKNSAAANISTDILNKINFGAIKITHLTGIFPALSEKSLLLTNELINVLHKKNIAISFDPNIRPSLWYSEDQMIETTNKIATQATIFLPGIKEARQLTNMHDPSEIANYYFSNSEYLKLIVIKDGKNGTYIFTKSGLHDFVPSFHVSKIIDTVGAGDGFALGLITSLLENKENLTQAVTRANAIGALAIQSPGDNDGYPTRQELREFLNMHLDYTR